MRLSRFWVETVALGITIGCACALLIGMLASTTPISAANAEVPQTTSSGPAAQPASGEASTFEGVVTCTRCGAKHSAALGRTAADCTRACVHAGANFALVDGDHVYALDGDLNILKKSAGERVRVTGALHEHKIEVTTIAAAD
jgi:hypothetical protein